MQTLILDEASLQKLVVRVGIHQLMDELIARLHRAFASFDPDVTQIPRRTGFHYDQPTGLIEWMPLHQRGGQVLMKMVGYHPHSPRQVGLPTIVSTLSTYDTSTGHLTAMVDGTLLTALRTGAASAVASHFLARPESRVLGLVGCGAQAVTQLHAISRRFELSEVLIHDIDPAALESFPLRAAGSVSKNASIRRATPREIAGRADIICTATSVEAGRGPVLPLTRTRPWLHVNAVGSDLPGKTELPREFLLRSFVCPDFPQQARIEGECQQLPAERIGPTITDIAKSPELGHAARHGHSVFDSTGWALEDWVAVELVMQRAAELGIGQQIAIEYLPEDPRNPYEFLTTRPSPPPRAVAAST